MRAGGWAGEGRDAGRDGCARVCLGRREGAREGKGAGGREGAGSGRHVMVAGPVCPGDAALRCCSGARAAARHGCGCACLGASRAPVWWGEVQPGTRAPQSQGCHSTTQHMHAEPRYHASPRHRHGPSPPRAGDPYNCGVPPGPSGVPRCAHARAGRAPAGGTRPLRGRCCCTRWTGAMGGCRSCRIRWPTCRRRWRRLRCGAAMVVVVGVGWWGCAGGGGGGGGLVGPWWLWTGGGGCLWCVWEQCRE